MDALLAWCAAAPPGASATVFLAPPLVRLGLLDNAFDALDLDRATRGLSANALTADELGAVLQRLGLDAEALAQLLDGGGAGRGPSLFGAPGPPGPPGDAAPPLLDPDIAFAPDMLALFREHRFFLYSAYALATLRDLPPLAPQTLAAPTLWTALVASGRRLRLRGFLWLLRELRLVPTVLGAAPASKLFEAAAAAHGGAVTVTAFCALLLAAALAAIPDASHYVSRRTPAGSLRSLLEMAQDAAADLAAAHVFAAAAAAPRPGPGAAAAGGGDLGPRSSPAAAAVAEPGPDASPAGQAFAWLCRRAGLLDNRATPLAAAQTWARLAGAAPGALAPAPAPAPAPARPPRTCCRRSSACTRPGAPPRSCCRGCSRSGSSTPCGSTRSSRG